MTDEDPYVVVQCTSATLNQMFKKRPVPYAWQHRMRASEVEAFKRTAASRWPDVTVTVKKG